MSTEIKPTLRVRLPIVPNWLMVTDERISGDHKIHVSRVPEDQLRELGRQWTDALVAKSRAGRTED